MENIFDVIVVGAGPGGYVAAIRASQLGFNTAVVERAELGGVCLNWGCIPTKALLKSAQVLNYTKHLADYGVVLGDAQGNEIEAGSVVGWPDIKKIVERERGVSATMSKGIEYLFKKNKITVIKGEAFLPEAGKVEVTFNDGENAGNKEVFEAKHIILATGARPNSLPFAPIDGEKIISYRQALVPETLPKSMAVIGSGAIGSELAFFYRSMGVEVYLIEYMDQIVPLEDADVAAQPVEPRGKRRRKLILVKTAPRPQKRLLRQIHRVIRFARHPIAEIVDVFLMFEQQLLKGVRIAALRAADQKFILQDPHLKSRLIPAAMAAMSSIVEIEEIFSL